MTYEVKPGISKSISAVIHCCDCGQPMHSVYSRSVRHTCRDCGGEALKDSVVDLKLRRIERDKRIKVERENKRLLNNR